MDDDLKAIEASSRRFADDNDFDMPGDPFSADDRGIDVGMRRTPYPPRGGFSPGYSQSPSGGYLQGRGGFGQPNQGYRPGNAWHDHQQRPDFTNVNYEHLSDEERDKLLSELLVNHNSHTQALRDIYIEDAKEDLQTKKKLSRLGFQFLKWGGISIGCAVATLLGITAYGVVADKQIIDSSIISGFMRVFSELVKTIFSAN